jgi:DNA-binding XRE family transcriptional regulator
MERSQERLEPVRGLGPHNGPRGHRTRVLLPYLRAWRLHALLSQDELARRSGIAKTSIVRLEKAQQGAILSTVGKLSQGLGITRQQLVYEDPGQREGSPP